MGLNELIIRNKGELADVSQSYELFNESPKVYYYIVDTSRYTFEYKLNDYVKVNMSESDRMFDSDEFVEAEFDDSIDDKNFSYYLIAAASGIITEKLSQLKLSKENLDKINEWDEKYWKKIIIAASKVAGYKKSDYMGAVEFLKDRFVSFFDAEIENEIKEGFNNWLKYLSNHPSLAGLVFSVLTQFSGKKYSFGKEGLEKENVPEYYAIGRNPLEKMVYGILYWIFNLSVDKVSSNRMIIEDMKIPKVIISLLKEFIKFINYKNIPLEYKDIEKKFSSWLKKTFEKSDYEDEDGNIEKFDLNKIMDAFNYTNINKNIPVIVNECIVRAFYFIKKLTVEIKEKNIRSISGLNKVSIENILPFNNRLISRMILISSGCFVGTNIAGIVVKELITNKRHNRVFLKTLFAEVNIEGVGRFIFACVADSKYWSEDIKIIFSRKEKKKKEDRFMDEQEIADNMISNEALKFFALDHSQARALYSLENLMVINDIEHTIDSKKVEAKERWHKLWQNSILSGQEAHTKEYFVTDEDEIYDVLCSVKKTEDNLRWFYLLTMELVLFEPYHPLGVKEDNEFKKLKTADYDYISDQFVRRQTIVSQAEVDDIKDSYKKYKGIISGKTKSTIIATGVTTVTAIATGGLALTFAPEIAALIAGEAVVGLHGAALTSASLAFVGGGSIAAGGMGVAGGTAIITGGGALLGIAGSGGASVAAILSQADGNYWERQSEKILVFSKCVLKNKLNDIDLIRQLEKVIDDAIVKFEENIKELEEENCSLDKETIKNSKNCLKYLNRCKNETVKLCDEE